MQTVSHSLVRHRCTSFQWAMYMLAEGSKHKAPLMDSVKERAQSGEKSMAVHHQWCTKTSQGISRNLQTYSRFQISAIIMMIKDTKCQPTENHRVTEGISEVQTLCSSFSNRSSPLPATTLEGEKMEVGREEQVEKSDERVDHPSPPFGSPVVFVCLMFCFVFNYTQIMPKLMGAMGSF